MNSPFPHASEEAVDIALKFSDPREAAQALVKDLLVGCEIPLLVDD